MNDLQSTPDPSTPTCDYCGARVFDPCSGAGAKPGEHVTCELPPDQVYVDARRFKMPSGGPSRNVDGLPPEVRQAIGESTELPPLGDSRRIAHGPTPEQIFDCENNVEPPRTIAERIVFNPTRKLIDDIAHAIEDAREIGAARKQAYIDELQHQLAAEGEHTAAANANIDRLNTEIERVTRRQQGALMGKD